MGIGLTGYELKSLGLLRRPRRESLDAGIAAVRAKEQLESVAATERYRTRSKGMLSVFYEALTLAQRKFGIDFRESDTLREILDKLAKGDVRGMELFSSIVGTTEDFLYAPRFDEGRVQGAERQLAELRKEWGGAGR